MFLSFVLVASQPWTSPWQFLDAKWLSTWTDSGRIEELKAAEGKLRHEKDKLEKRRRTWKHHKGCACFARWTRHSLKQCLKDFNGLETASGNRFLVTHPIGSYDIIVYIYIIIIYIYIILSKGIYCTLRRLHDPYQVAVQLSWLSVYCMFCQYKSLHRISSIFSRKKTLKVAHDSKSEILLSRICFYHVSGMLFVLRCLWPGT